MNIKDVSTFGEEIKKKYDEDGKLFLPKPTPLNIQKRILHLIETPLKSIDTKIVFSFFEIQNDTKSIHDIVKDVDLGKFKPVQNFLMGKTSLRFEEGFNFIAWLIDFEPRPYTNYLECNYKVKDKKEERENVEPSNTTPNTNSLQQKSIIKATINNKNSKGLYLVTILAIVVIAISSFYFFNQKGNTTINVGGVEINNDFRQIYPTEKTQFFSERNKPVVWYTSHNNQLEFFNQKGFHPITKEVLNPITKEVVERYFMNEESLNKLTEIIKKSATINEEKSLVASESKLEKNKEISVYVIESIGKKDISFSIQMQNELKNKSYTIINNQLPIVNLENIEALKSGNNTFLKSNSITDYVCVGNTSYTYSKNEILKNQITCKMLIEYSIIAIETGEVIKSYSNLINGFGSTEVSAKNNTIKKFSL